MWLKKSGSLLMALPQSLGELSELLELTLICIPVTCYYCEKVCTLQDKVLFSFSELSLFWNNNVYYISCQSCLRAAARLEFLMYYQDLQSTREIEALFRKPFRELKIRCLCCYRYLNLTEKQDVVSSNENVALVRGEPRALCVLCKIGVP